MTQNAMQVTLSREEILHAGRRFRRYVAADGTPEWKALRAYGDLKAFERLPPTEQRLLEARYQHDAD